MLQIYSDNDPGLPELLTLELYSDSSSLWLDMLQICHSRVRGTVMMVMARPPPAV